MADSLMMSQNLKLLEFPKSLVMYDKWSLISINASNNTSKSASTT